jgi:hypothetical protein
VRHSLDLVEDGIEIDHTHRWRRLEIDGIVYDRTEHGLMVSYAIEDDIPVLLTFTDLWDR